MEPAGEINDEEATHRSNMNILTARFLLLLVYDQDPK